MNPLILCVATMRPEDVPASEHLVSFTRESTLGFLDWKIRRNTADDNLGVVDSYTWLWEHTIEPLLAFVHDDVICRERGWDARVVREFEDPSVGVVGFGGAFRHGTPDLYKTPYRLQQLGRFGYLSNTDDAETHGERFEGATDVAVLDGFALVVRRELLDRIGGWPPVVGGFHCYDYAICCAARRYGYRVRCVGIRCHHLGGRTSTTPQYQEWSAKRGISDQQVHELSHRWIYDEYRDVLPYEVKHGQ